MVFPEQIERASLLISFLSTRSSLPSVVWISLLAHSYVLVEAIPTLVSSYQRRSKLFRLYSNGYNNVLSFSLLRRPFCLEEPGFRRMPIIRAREFLIQHLIQQFSI